MAVPVTLERSEGSGAARKARSGVDPAAFEPELLRPRFFACGLSNCLESQVFIRVERWSACVVDPMCGGV